MKTHFLFQVVASATQNDRSARRRAAMIFYGALFLAVVAIGRAQAQNLPGLPTV